MFKKYNNIDKICYKMYYLYTIWKFTFTFIILLLHVTMLHWLHQMDLFRLICVTSPFSSTKAVQNSVLVFQSVYDVHGSDGFPLCVFNVRDSSTNNVFKGHLRNTTSFFIDQARCIRLTRRAKRMTSLIPECYHEGPF